MGEMLFAAGDADEALVAYRKSLEISPIQPQALFGVGRIEAFRGNDTEAMRELRLAEDFAKGGAFISPAILANIAYGYSRLGQRADAERLFTELQDMADDFRIGARSWAMAYMALGDYSEAANRLRSVVDNPGPDEGLNASGAFEDIVLNRWNDPALEESEFVELREQLGFTDL